MIEKKITCSACGAANAPDGSRFCPDCGTNLSVESEDVNTMDTPLARAVPFPEDYTSSTTPQNGDIPSTIGTTVSTAEPSTDMHRAMYFKNPSRDMLERASKHDFKLGVMFVMTPERKGKYTAPETISAITLMGGGKIDFSRADFVYPETTILVAPCIMGGLIIKVPRGVRVEIRGIGIMGGMKGLKTQNMPVGQTGPLVIIKGVAIMGGVKVVLNQNVPPIKVVE
eukprot:scaffold14050_cov163-Cylindrotheca_fusiformis.AAC.3